MKDVTELQREQWHCDGYLLLRGLIGLEAIHRVRRVMARAVDVMIGQLYSEGLIKDEGEHLPLEKRFTLVAGELAQRFGRGWRRALAAPEVFDLHRVPALLDVIGELIGPDVIGHPVFNGRPKLPHQRLTVVPWHQDSSYYGPASQQHQIISVWIPLVPVDRSNGCIEVIAGSHRWGLRRHIIEASEGKFLAAQVTEVEEAGAVTCGMVPGDALLFSNLTMHRSLANASNTIRWSVDIRYIRDGDPVGEIGWHDPTFKWVIRSDAQAATGYEAWLAEVSQSRW